MTKPSDRAIAQAFYEAKQLSAERAPQYQVAYNFIIDRASELDATAPASPSREVESLHAQIAIAEKRLAEAKAKVWAAEETLRATRI